MSTNLDSALLLGLGLGFRHAADADHLVAIGSLLEAQKKFSSAVRVAALWGAGHTASFIAVGGVIVAFGIRPPPQFDAVAELLVALMLVGLGSWQLACAWRGVQANPGHARPIAVGLVHGLAGSASLGLMCATTISPASRAIAYLSLFGAGTVLGMTVLTATLALALRRAAVSQERAWRWVRAGSALGSLALGLFLAAHLASEHLAA